METIQGNSIPRETKKDIVYVRMDKTMLGRLKQIRRKSGIPVSEIIRESVRVKLLEVEEKGSLNIKID